MKLTKSKLKQIIKEELEDIKEGGVWEHSPGSFDAVRTLSQEIAKETGLKEHTVGVQIFEFVEQTFYNTAQNEPLNEDLLGAMDIKVLEGFLQVMNNFGIVTWPTLAAAMAMSVIETKEAVQRYLARKRGVNLKVKER